MYASRSGSILTHSGRFMSWKGEFNCPISFHEKTFNVLTNLWMINMFVLIFSSFWTPLLAHTCAHAHLSLHCWMFCQGNVMCVWCGFVSFSVLRSLILNIHQIYVFSYIINVLNKRVSDQSHSDLSFFLTKLHTFVPPKRGQVKSSPAICLAQGAQKVFWRLDANTLHPVDVFVQGVVK